MPSGPKPRPLADRIWHGIEIDDSGCWICGGPFNTHGYPRMSIGSRTDGTRRTVPAHRVSYELFKGDIPEGLHLDHLCRNPPCVNPDHLEPVTSRENTVVRGVGGVADQARQTHCKRGHEFTDENTYRHSNKRYCRTCLRDYNRKYQARKRREVTA